MTIRSLGHGDLIGGAPQATARRRFQTTLLTVFAAIRTNQHSAKWLEAFSKAVVGIPEILEVYRMSGQIDYMLRIVVPDIAAYDRVYRRLIAAIEIYDVSSAFAMEELKHTTCVPIPTA